jgi:hypothetical protein
MNNDHENLSEIQDLIEALQLTINQADEHQSIEHFTDKVLQKLLVKIEPTKHTPNTSNQVVKSILKDSLTMAQFKASSSFSENELDQLIKLKVLSLDGEKVFYRKPWTLRPMTASILITFAILMALISALYIIYSPYSSIRAWPMSYLMGLFIGTAIRFVLSRSFKVYEVLGELENYIDWLPKQAY